MLRSPAQCVLSFALCAATLVPRRALAEEAETTQFRGLALVPFVRVDSLAPDLSVGLDFDPVSWVAVGVATGLAQTGISGSVSGRLRIPLLEGERSAFALTLETAYSTFPKYTYSPAGCTVTTSGWADGGLHCYNTLVRIHDRPTFWSGLIGVEWLLASGIQLRVYGGGGRLVNDRAVHEEHWDGPVDGGGKEGVAGQFGAAVGYRFGL